MENVCFGACDQENAVVDHVLETDVRTVVLCTLSSRLTPVVTRYALVAKDNDNRNIKAEITFCRPIDSECVGKVCILVYRTDGVLCAGHSQLSTSDAHLQL